MLVLADLEHASPHLVVRAADGVRNLFDGYLVGLETVRIEIDLILLHEPAHRRDLGNSVHALEPVAEVPILERSDLGEVVPARRVDQGILEHPSHAGGVRTQLGRDPLGEAALDGGEVLEHAAPRPVEIDAVLEDHVDEGVADHAEPADVLHAGHAAKRGHDGVRHLVLDDVGAPAHPLGRDDHLGIREIRDRVERRIPEGADAEARRDEDRRQGEDAVPRAPGNEAFDHRVATISAPWI